MSELDLLNLGRSVTATEVSFFTQIIGISFAMIVAIYYFLHQARLLMKVFAFVVYTMGMFLFMGEMLVESGVKYMVLRMMSQLPNPSAITQQYVGLNNSWIAVTTMVLFNGSFWVLWIGISCLLFFWRRDAAARD